MLYIVATPIGNLKDFSFRAKEVLLNVDYILCEDTRTSSVLLNEYNIKKPLIAYHKFNEKQELEKIIFDLQRGLNIALISDAGTPCISDPGAILVNELILKGLDYTVIPGATAFVNAFVLSGFSAPFTFVGFLPNKNSEKREVLKEYKEYKNTLIFYNSKYDLLADMEDMYNVFGDRKVAVVGDITKLHEKIEFTTLSKGYSGTIKGEFAVVVEGKTEEDNPLNMLSVAEHLEFYINLGYKKSDAIEMVSADRKMKKNEVYKIAHTEVER